MERLAHITSACRDLQAQLQNERTVRKNICGILENRITKLEINLTSYSERPKQDREDRPDIDNDVTTDHFDITAPPLENAGGNDTLPPGQPVVSLFEFSALPDMSTSTPKSQNSTRHQTTTANSEQGSQEARASGLSIVTAASEINNKKDSSSNSSSNGSSNISKNSSSDSSSSSAHPTTSTESGEDRTYSDSRTMVNTQTCCQKIKKENEK